MSLHKWTDLRLELSQFCKENNISENDFRFLGIYEWENVYKNMLKHFVDEMYARKYGIHWANIDGGFKKDINKIYSFQMGVDNNKSYEWIEEFPKLVKDEKVYLFLEGDYKYWVAECSSAIVQYIVYELADDYYITDKKFNWLITENHHEIITFIGNGIDMEVIKEACQKKKCVTEDEGYVKIYNGTGCRDNQ